MRIKKKKKLSLFSSLYLFKGMSKLTLLLLSVISIVSVASINVTNIDECPSLTPRASPDSVHDLRADDIKVVGALGDR